MDQVQKRAAALIAGAVAIGGLALALPTTASGGPSAPTASAAPAARAPVPTPGSSAGSRPTRSCGSPSTTSSSGRAGDRRAVRHGELLRARRHHRQGRHRPHRAAEPAPRRRPDRRGLPPADADVLDGRCRLPQRRLRDRGLAARHHRRRCRRRVGQTPRPWSTRSWTAARERPLGDGRDRRRPARPGRRGRRRPRQRDRRARPPASSTPDPAGINATGDTYVSGSSPAPTTAAPPRSSPTPPAR